MLLRRVVVQSDDDNRLRCGKNLSGVGPLFRVARHIAHLALITARKPLLQPPALGRELLYTHDANFVESKFERLVCDFRRAYGTVGGAC